MSIYTYEVDHGQESPRISAGMYLNGGKVTAVCFDAVLERLELFEEALQSIANNTCCGDCREARRVAEKVLNKNALEDFSTKCL